VDFSFEEKFWSEGLLRVAGVDEAGRGPLAGPVVAAAVVFGPGRTLDGLNDSKKLTAARREALHARITGGGCLAWSIAILDAGEIDRLNILRATHRAMAVALGGLVPWPEHAIVDGLPVTGLPVPHTAVVGGDALVASVAAAGIVAKVERDRLMRAADAQYPEYGFARHKGYATREHLAKLHDHGPSPIHRRSFAPVAQCAFNF
jgi:ribonuclease HII